MTVYVVLADHPDHGTEIIAAFKHDPTSEEISAAVLEHVRQAFYDDQEGTLVLNADEIKAEVMVYENFVTHSTDLLD